MLNKEKIKELLNQRFEKDIHKKLSEIPTPDALKDVFKGAERIKRAIEQNEKIVVVGDYDVDGVIASVIMAEFFDDLGVSEYFVRIPNRFSDGYGLNPQIVGKGSIKDLKQLRQTTVKTFNFETLEMTKEILTDAAYEGFDKVLAAPDSFQVDSVKQIQHSANKSETEIVISKKHEEEDEIIEVAAQTDNSQQSTQSAQENTTPSGIESDIADIMKFVGAFKGDFKGDSKSLRAEKADELNQKAEQ